MGRQTGMILGRGPVPSIDGPEAPRLSAGIASPKGMAMEAGIFALLGVIIGGVLTGGIDLLLERRRERRQTRTAARAILMHLSDVSEYAAEVLANGHWLPVGPRIWWARISGCSGETRWPLH